MIRTSFWSILISISAGTAIGYALASTELRPIIHATPSVPAAAPRDTATSTPFQAALDDPVSSCCSSIHSSPADQVTHVGGNPLVAAAFGQAKQKNADKKPNILVIFGDDIGTTNLSCYSDGLMGYTTPHIDRLADEGLRFLHYYGEQSCTAGRSAFLTGQHIIRTGLSKFGFPMLRKGEAKE